MEAACAAMVSLSNDAKMRIRIGTKGGVKSIADAMVLFAEEPSLMEQACRAMRHLSFEDKNRALAGEAGAVESCVAAMDRYINTEHVKVHEQASRALLNLCTNSSANKARARAAGAIDAAFKGKGSASSAAVKKKSKTGTSTFVK